MASCVSYIIQMFSPLKLALLYPYPVQGVNMLQFWAALLVLAVISLFVYRAKTK